MPIRPQSDVYHRDLSEGGYQRGELPTPSVSVAPAQQQCGVSITWVFVWDANSHAPLLRPLCVGLAQRHTENTNVWPVTDDTQLSARWTTSPLSYYQQGQQGHCHSSLDYSGLSHISIYKSLSFKTTHVSPRRFKEAGGNKSAAPFPFLEGQGSVIHHSTPSSCLWLFAPPTPPVHPPSVAQSSFTLPKWGIS